MPKKVDLLGERFGKLVVIAEAPKKRNRTAWKCKCDCGKEAIVTTSDLRTGNTTSCGCSHGEALKKWTKEHAGSPRLDRIIDLTGKVFGRLTVIRQSGRNEKGIVLWECKCECGNVVSVRGDTLRYGLTKSCGCLAKEVRANRCRNVLAKQPSKKLIDLTGQVFGRLTVIRRLTEEEGARRGQPKWLCQCECGNTTHTGTSKLTTGKTKSCGCLGLENATKAKIKHGHARAHNGEKLYYVWNSMKRRCDSPNVSVYKYYGGKGVKVCAEWLDFASFRNWAISNGYKEGLTIDRIDPNGDYEPSNCRWITAFENSSRAHLIDKNTREAAISLVKEGKTFKEAANLCGVSRLSVKRWCDTAHVKSGKSWYTDDFKRLVQCLYKEGMRPTEIINIAGIGSTTYLRWIKEIK